MRKDGGKWIKDGEDLVPSLWKRELVI